MQETHLRHHKGYKGHIRWVKLKIRDHIFKIEKRRNFGRRDWQSYTITEAEYNWIDSPKRAQQMWDFCHYYNTASWFSGDLAHPITGQKYDETLKDEKPGERICA